MSYGAPYAACVLLPGWFRLVCATAAARASPYRLALAGVVCIEVQSRAANRGHVLRGGGVLDSVAAIAGGESNRDAHMIEMPIVGRCGLAREFPAAPGVGDNVGVRPRVV